MPTQQELNISSGSLSLIKQRDSGSGVIFVNPTDSNVDIKMENTSFKIDNKSVNEHIDTAFSYYKFPARVIVEDISDVDLTAQLEAVTVDTALFYRYQATPMVLPNLDIVITGKPLEIIKNPQQSFINSTYFTNFGGRGIENRAWRNFQGLASGESISDNNNAFFNRVTNAGYISGEPEKHQGVRYYLRQEEEYRDSRLTAADEVSWKKNNHTGGEIGFFLLGWTNDKEAITSYIDEFIIYEPYIKNSINLEDSYFYKIYNAIRYTTAGRRIVELDHNAKKQVRDGTSKGRYIISSKTDNEFGSTKFREYQWRLSYNQANRVSYVVSDNGAGKRSMYAYQNSDGTLYIPEISFKLNYKFNSILDENFKEISFNQLIDGSQQIANRFTVTKDVLGYNANILFKVNIGLSHLNDRSTFIIRLIRYNGTASKKYTIVKQYDHTDITDRTVLQTSDVNIELNKTRKSLLELQTFEASEVKKLATEKAIIAQLLAAIAANVKKLEDSRQRILVIDQIIVQNELTIISLRNNITDWRNRLFFNYNKEIAKAASEIISLTNTNKELQTEKNTLGTLRESLTEANRDYNREIYTASDRTSSKKGFDTQQNLTDASIVVTRKKIVDIQTYLNSLPGLTGNADIILGEGSYITPGKTNFQFTHEVNKSDLNIYDSYAIEILTNSPFTTNNINANQFDYKEGVAMELIADNTSWEIMPMTEYTKKYTDTWIDGLSVEKIQSDIEDGNGNSNDTGNAGVTLTEDLA